MDFFFKKKLKISHENIVKGKKREKKKKFYFMKELVKETWIECMEQLKSSNETN